MTTQVLIKKLNREVGTLKEEVREMKKFLFTPFEDPEGKYKPSFVKKILAREREEASYRFTTKEDFLKQIYERKK